MLCSHRSALKNNASYHLPLLRRLCLFQVDNDSENDVALVIYTSITPCQDYSKPLLTSMKSSGLRNGQRVQNTAAPLLSNTTCQNHITHACLSLFLFQLNFEQKLKVLFLIFKALNGLGSTYLNDRLKLWNRDYLTSIGLLWHSGTFSYNNNAQSSMKTSLA